MKKNLKGIYAATVVPLKKNKSINEIALKKIQLSNYLVKKPT